jgi:hypothetical protein
VFWQLVKTVCREYIKGKLINRYNICVLLFYFSEARKPEGEDVFMHDDEDANVPVEEKKDEAGGWTEVKETQNDEQPNAEDKEDIVPDETIHEVAVGKGLSGALKLLKDRGTLKESVEWGGRNMDKKKSKLVGIVEDEGKEAPNKKEIHIERTDEFGRIVSLPCSFIAFFLSYLTFTMALSFIILFI